jgi:hypothetical protein
MNARPQRPFLHLPPRGGGRHMQTCLHVSGEGVVSQNPFCRRRFKSIVLELNTEQESYEETPSPDRSATALRSTSPTRGEVKSLRRSTCDCPARKRWRERGAAVFQVHRVGIPSAAVDSLRLALGIGDRRLHVGAAGAVAREHIEQQEVGDGGGRLFADRA